MSIKARNQNSIFGSYVGDRDKVCNSRRLDMDIQLRREPRCSGMRWRCFKWHLITYTMRQTPPLSNYLTEIILTFFFAKPNFHTMREMVYINHLQSSFKTHGNCLGQRVKLQRNIKNLCREREDKA